MLSISRIVQLSKDWRHLIQRDGWKTTWPVFRQELLRLSYERSQFVVIARSLLEPIPDLLPKIALEVRPINYPDIEIIRNMISPYYVKKCTQRLRCGHRGVLALAKDRPVAYAWACTAKDPILDRIRPELEPSDVLFVDDYTDIAFRGHGIHTELTLVRLRLFQNLGYQRALACVQPSNGPSLAVYRKVGSQEIGMIDYQRFGSLRNIRFIGE